MPLELELLNHVSPSKSSWKLYSQLVSECVLLSPANSQSPGVIFW